MGLALVASGLVSPLAAAQGDILGSNRNRPRESSTNEGPPPDERARPDRPYVADPDADLRWVRLLGKRVVYRLEPPGGGQRVYRDLDPVNVVVCADPPCDVWLPRDASLAVQLRGRDFALGQLTPPPYRGVLWTAIGGRGRRIAAGLIMIATTAAALVLFIAGGAEDPDAFLSLQPLYFGFGAMLFTGGLVAGGVMLAIPRRGVARWRTIPPGANWH